VLQVSSVLHVALGHLVLVGSIVVCCTVLVEPIVQSPCCCSGMCVAILLCTPQLSTENFSILLPYFTCLSLLYRHFVVVCIPPY
jgi:hypothetical protein